jgi:hypothetical protein
MTATAKNMQNLVKKIKEKKPIIKDTGLKLIAFRTTPEADRQLAILAAHVGRTRQELLNEAMNKIFIENGYNPIA